MYYKKVNLKNVEECFNFCKEHYTYWTMNSWNGLESIANNVKLYNLNLEGDYWNARLLMLDEDYCCVNEMLYDFEHEHERYSVGFNGSNDGYLVLGNKNNNSSVLPDCVLNNDTYKEYKEYCKEYYDDEHACDYDIIEITKVIIEFDKLCDKLRDYVNELSKCDAVSEIVKKRLYNFIEEYETELDESKIELELKNRTIDITKLKTKKSLYDCFLNRMKDNLFDYDIKDNIITFE